MTLGAQSAATCNVAMAVESVSGVFETSPDQYIIMGGDVKPVPDKPSATKQVASQPFPTLPYKGIETFGMAMPMLPVTEDATSPTVLRNGLGELLLCLLGANTPAQLGSTAAYKKTFTWEDLIKTFTLWLHYTERDMKARMCAIDSLDLNIKNTGELTLDFAAKGANLEDTSDYGVESQIDLATAKQLSGLAGRIEWGQPQAGVRDTWDDVKLSLKRTLDYGAPGKAGQHPAGSGSPQIVTSTKSEARITVAERDLDGEEFERWRVGGNTAPSADRHTDLITLIKARLSIWGPNIAEGIHGEADYNNAGTTVGTFAGTYSGGANGTIGEIEMDPHTYETALGTNKDLAFHLKDVAATYEVVTGEGALSVAVVGKAITVTLASGGSTASAVLAALLASSPAIALMDFALAPGSSGAGAITLAQTLIDHDDFIDGFRFRYTTGAGWGDWSSWRWITKTVAQDLVYGMTVTFDDDDITADGDKFYFYSHYRHMLRVNLPNMVFEKATPDYSGGIRRLTMEAYHTSAATGDRPTLELVDTRTTAYA